MRIQGRITRWNPEKGFGFITPSSGPKQVFVHISAFGNRGLPPKIGEFVSFDLSTDREGRPRAANVLRLGEQPAQDRPPRMRRSERAVSGGRMGSLLFISLLVAGGVAYSKFSQSRAAVTAVPTVAATARAPAQAQPSFRCDGRTHCSHMTSCAEATYFIRSCPNTQMDGDHDGVPCESQWCGR